jgi:23S rRNA (guanosine2251-2'-O)-methyltransferase
MKYSVLLHNIRSAYNVGSIFRTADAAGFNQVYLSGYTPLPIDRFGRVRSDIDKVALGAQDSVSWTQIEDVVSFLKNSEALIVAVEQDECSVPYTDLVVPEGTEEIILVMGEETQGIETELLSLIPNVVELPMRGNKESLNVSVCFGIVAYEITKKL